MDLTADQTFFVFTFFVLIKIFFKRYLLKRGTTWNDLKQPETTYNEQKKQCEMTWNDL